MKLDMYFKNKKKKKKNTIQRLDFQNIYSY